MTLDDRMRLRLLPKLEELFGAEEADALMDEFSHPDWGDLATKADLRELGVELRGEMAELRGEVRSLGGELRAEMGDLRAEMGDLRAEMGDLRAEMGDLRAEMGGLRAEMGGLRAEMGGLRAEMHDSIRNQTWHLVTFVCAFNAVLVAVCGVVVATLI